MIAMYIIIIIIIMLLMIIILFKKLKKEKCVLSMDLLYTHIGVRCGNTVITVVYY